MDRNEVLKQIERAKRAQAFADMQCHLMKEAVIGCFSPGVIIDRASCLDGVSAMMEYVMNGTGSAEEALQKIERGYKK